MSAPRGGTVRPDDTADGRRTPGGQAAARRHADARGDECDPGLT